MAVRGNTYIRISAPKSLEEYILKDICCCSTPFSKVSFILDVEKDIDKVRRKNKFVSLQIEIYKGNHHLSLLKLKPQIFLRLPLIPSHPLL